MIIDQFTTLSISPREKYVLRHPDRYKASQRAYVLRNPEKNRAWQEKYRLANPEKLSESRSKYQKKNWIANREKMNARARPYNLLYKARKKNAIIGVVDLAKLVDEWDRKCGICGEFVYDQYDVDHIVPLSKGGAHTQSNLQLAHSSCNRRKGNRV